MWRKLGIEPGEGRIFAWGTAVLFLLGWSDASLTNAAEVFFNKRVGTEYFPWAFLASSLLLVVTTWSFGRLAARSDGRRLLPRTLLVLGLLLLPLWGLVRADVFVVFPLLVIAEKQMTSIALLVFVIAMGDLLHGRQAKRLFAPMMAGVTVGTILGSFASGPIGGALGIDALVPLAALTLSGGAAMAVPLGRLRPRLDRGPAGARRASEGEGPETLVSLREIWGRSPLFRLLLVTALCSGLLGPMLYFQFQWVANRASPGEQGLLEFYALFRGWIYGGVLIAQLVIAGSLYRRIGIPLAAALSPVIYLAGFLGLSVRLSLPVGVGAMAGTKLQDNAIYDPALRVLYNLFPEMLRSRATALLEGPAKRAGGALGNAVVILALRIGSTPWVGYLAIPITLLWLGVALHLWRSYPRLLLSASASASRRDRGAMGEDDLLDPATVRALVPEMCSADPARSRVAIELVAEAPAERAVSALAAAASGAPTERRAEIVAALDRVLEAAVGEPVESPEAARDLEILLDAPVGLEDRERADMVQAYGRLQPGEAALPRLEAALDDEAAAVRLAALAALARRGRHPDRSPPLDEALAEALVGDDVAARRTAREEVRALLLCDGDAEAWEGRLELLARSVGRAADRVEAAEAVAEVAQRHGHRTAGVGETLLALRDDPSPGLRASLLRYAGHAGLESELPWLVEHVGSSHEAWSSAARDGLCALGAACSTALLRELSFGQRSKREGILAVMRTLDIPPDELRSLYRSEVDAAEEDLRLHLALDGRPAYALLRQRLGERAHEQLHTALLFLAAIRHEDRIAELGERLQQVGSLRRQHAIVIEALEALLPGDERDRLLPLLEDPDPAEAARVAVGRETAPTAMEAVRRLLEDPEPLTRTIAAGQALASGVEVDQDGDVDAVEKMVHLRALPLFEGLTVRQLMDLAAVVKEYNFGSQSEVVHEGDCDDRLFLVVEGVVHIVRGDTLLAEMGPGDFFGEIALFEGVARSATAVTQTRARLLGLERADLLKLIEEMPGISVSLLVTLSRRVRELTDRLMV